MTFPTIFGNADNELKYTRTNSYMALANERFSKQCAFMLLMCPGAFTIIDVRSEAEYNKSHINEAYNIPFDFQTTPFVDTDAFAKIMQSRPGTIAVVYCSSSLCKKALFSATMFAYVGYDPNKGGSAYPVRVLAAGFDECLNNEKLKTLIV